MQAALTLAVKADAAGEIPIGAVVTDPTGRIIGEGWNQPESSYDPTAHAEMLAIRQACATLGNWRLTDCTLYVTLEPCPMCAWASIQARVGRVVFGAGNVTYGAAGGAVNLYQLTPAAHRIEVLGGIGDVAATALLDGFFAKRRSPDSLH
ncbi:MAG: nucleoside deaminase [Candidatus Sericytochromatia bacterium]|nr:nucleoside deaminase [Candidatus Sericytochromatia bacterium]